MDAVHFLRAYYNRAISYIVKSIMPDFQERYDEAMFHYSRGEYDAAIQLLESILNEDPEWFEAQLSLGMVYFRKEDFQRAIEEGHKAEKLRPKEALVHTNLSLFYMRAGDKQKAEHHGLQARISSWRDNMAPPGSAPAPESELQMAKPAWPPPPPPEKFPDMPWKKKPKIGE